MEKPDPELYDHLFLSATSMLERGDAVPDIESVLLLQCDDIVLVTVVIKEARNAHYAKLSRQGFRLILLGCITGLSGFVLTFLNFNTNRSIDFAMYGLTSAGLTIVFWGLFKILG
jgi:hypothetical protein